ncbi:MAG: ATP synthase F1 subunit gamma [Bacteroidota bacterium]
MANLKEVRTRIKSVKNTQQTTRAMKMVSAAKLRRAQDLTENLRPYARKLKQLLQNVAETLRETEALDLPYLEQRDDLKTILYVVITSNRGLAGAFNTAICRAAEEDMKERFPDQLANNQIKVMAIGKKGFEYFRRLKFDIVGSENKDAFAKVEFDHVVQYAEEVMQGFADGSWDHVMVAFNESKNVATQLRKVEQFLPVELDEHIEDDQDAVKPDYIIEPDPIYFGKLLVPQILKTSFFSYVLASNASEHGARMVSMDNATENAQELLDDLKLTYNKARQAAITTEILEIVSGANALSEG